ncbi:proteasome subunit alpha type-1 [Anopheles darlingi]|uniref:Proteasome subunit alpha type n=1 Tax=Anopheles darlingi TaxID=43151 RepID=A0A2K6VB91_ANODA|nr:proteasome subunit alpha type-1 [Anopheles darlingi]
MFRNQYDSDVTVWSPQGRLHQVEYAMEAVKLGSATVGLKNKEYAVLIALKRASSELSSYQKKIISVDDHLGLSFAGITADARILSRYLRQECLNYKYAYDAFYPVGRLISTLGNKMQVCTQRYDRRPYGVGLLVIGFDDQGPHIYQTCPSANFFDCKAMSIGSRSQSARTYLEKHLNSFPECTKDELIRHGVQALQDTLPNEVDLNTKNISIAVVGKDEKFTILSEEDNDKYLSNIVRRGGAASEVGGGNQAPRDDGNDQPPNVPTDPIPIVAMET